MERPKPQPSESAEIMNALDTYTWDDDEFGMLILDPDDTVRIGRSRRTGQTELRTIYVGESSHTFEVPETEFYISETTQLGRIIRKHQKRMAKIAKQESYAEMIDESELASDVLYQRWAAERLQPDDIIEAAGRILGERTGYEPEMMTCAHCDGEAEYYQQCSCTFLISSITNIDGISTYDRAEGEPDPSCGRCGGTGGVTETCGSCDGLGYYNLYPEIEIFEPTAQKRHRIRLDLPRLITEFPDLVTQEIDCYEYGKDSRRADYRVRFDLGGAIASLAGVWRLDDEAVHIRYGNDLQYMRLYDEFYERASLLARDSWRKGTGREKPRSRAISNETVAEDTAPRGVIESNQRTLATSIKSDSRQWGISYEIVYSPTPERRFEDLRAALGQRGLSLAVAHEFIATGETGPTIYVAKGDDIVARLDQEYSVDRAIEGAWIRYQEIADKL